MCGRERSAPAWLRAPCERLDFSIHKPHRAGDERNHHAHVLTTTRVIEPAGLGEKSAIEWADKNRRKAGLSRDP
jgi:hypothetical protein